MFDVTHTTELVSTVGDYAHTIRDTVSTTVQSNVSQCGISEWV